MARLVVDTNCLIQSLPSWSPYHSLWLSLMDGRNQLCISNEILTEYQEILASHISPIIAEQVISRIINSPYTIQIIPYYNFELIKTDPDDNKFVDCAVACAAKFIVTEDKHFNVLKSIEFPKVEITTLDEFMKFMRDH